jgi:NAD(P)-dependent dehydrogenase (short-subunit alcohol dehydrogenase family)
MVFSKGFGIFINLTGGGLFVQSTGGLRIFNDAVSIITGAASGIGRGIAEELAERGSEVILADRQIEEAQKVASAIRSSGAKATAVEMDVADFPAMEQMVKETTQRTGRLDYMFNNAGISIMGDFKQHCIEDWNKILDVNLRGVINGAHAAYSVMTGQGFGHIVNTASMTGIVPSPGLVSYCTTKHAVVGLSTSLLGEAASHNIRVSVLCPGFIRTAIISDGGKYGKTFLRLTDEQQKHRKQMIDKAKPMDPRLFARKALNEVAKNKAIIVIPASIKVVWWIYRLFPSIGMFIGRQHYQKNLRRLRNPDLA